MSQDFLSDNSPLSAASASQAPGPADVNVVEISGSGSQCNTLGGNEQGAQTCLDRREDGSFSESVRHWEKFGDTEKDQTVTQNYSADGEKMGEIATRVKTRYSAEADGSRFKQREFYDIVTQPARGAITRELIVKDFDKSGRLTKTTWAHYREIGDRKAGLEHHAVIYYENEKPVSGFADKYQNGKVVDTLLNFNPEKNPNLRADQSGLMKWVSWIDRLLPNTQPLPA